MTTQTSLALTFLLSSLAGTPVAGGLKGRALEETAPMICTAPMLCTSPDSQDRCIHHSWFELGGLAQYCMKEFGYNSDNWYDPTFVMEELFWSDLSMIQEQCAIFFGYTEEEWNSGIPEEDEFTPDAPDAVCSDAVAQNYCNDIWFPEMSEELKEQAILLHYTEAIWNSEDRIDPNEFNYYIDLTPAQRAAVLAFGYNQETWDDDYLFWI